MMENMILEMRVAVAGIPVEFRFLLRRQFHTSCTGICNYKKAACLLFPVEKSSRMGLVFHKTTSGFVIFIWRWQKIGIPEKS